MNGFSLNKRKEMHCKEIWSAPVQSKGTHYPPEPNDSHHARPHFLILGRSGRSEHDKVQHETFAVYHKLFGRFSFYTNTCLAQNLTPCHGTVGSTIEFSSFYCNHHSFAPWFRLLTLVPFSCKTSNARKQKKTSPKLAGKSCSSYFSHTHTHTVTARAMQTSGLTILRDNYPVNGVNIS